MEYFGAETFTDEGRHNLMPISYKYKLFREMKDQLDRLLKKLKFTNETINKAKNIALHRVSHGGNYGILKKNSCIKCFIIMKVNPILYNQKGFNGTIYAMYYNVDLGYYFVFELYQYRIGTTLSSVPESLIALKSVLQLKNDIIKALDIVKEVKKIAI
ncbi:hypothetical protein C2G38_1141566 [Gigaspora rosea]|uniref:Uncharacterized protein n=1 Tax=Gigaspora rosea TaxID=44941 RepID=A0A397VG79_9GLOM|nr:hypothetical protein C2G38_1141566 [Gigaspora rosea]